MTLSPWTTLVLAAVFETGWAVGLKFVHGPRRALAIGWVLVSLAASMVLLERAARSIPIGTAYAVWTGLGAACTALMGMFWLGEPVRAARVFFLVLLVGAVVGLKATAR